MSTALDLKDGGNKPDVPGKAVTVHAERQRAQTEVEAQVFIAKTYPRNEATAMNRIIESVQSRQFAKEAFYAYPRGGKTIFGPSVVLAREIARLWGNTIYGYRIVHEDDATLTLEAGAWDIENNTRVFGQDHFKKLIQRKVKNDKTGITNTEWISPDERDLRELVGRRSAILVRNAILQLLPRDFIDNLVSVAMKNALKGENPEVVRQTLEADFSRFGVTKAALGKYLGVELEKATKEQLSVLLGIFGSISDGNSKPADYFGPTAETGGIAPTREKTATTQEKPAESPAKAPVSAPQARGEANAPAPAGEQGVGGNSAPSKANTEAPAKAPEKPADPAIKPPEQDQKPQPPTLRQVLDTAKPGETVAALLCVFSSVSKRTTRKGTIYEYLVEDPDTGDRATIALFKELTPNPGDFLLFKEIRVSEYNGNLQFLAYKGDIDVGF